MKRVALKSYLCQDDIESNIEGQTTFCNRWVRENFHPEIIDNKIVCICNLIEDRKTIFICPRLGTNNLMVQICLLLKYKEKSSGQKSNQG